MREGKKDHILDSSSQRLGKKSALEKILSNKDKFMKTYFNKLNKIQLSEGVEEMDKELEVLKLGEWRVKGFMKGEHVFFKAENDKHNRSKYFKFVYQKVSQAMRENYRDFVKSRILTDLE